MLPIEQGPSEVSVATNVKRALFVNSILSMFFCTAPVNGTLYKHAEQIICMRRLHIRKGSLHKS